MNLDTARNGTQTKCKMCNPAVWVPIFRKHRVSHLVHNNNGNVIWFHLHASIRSTLEFIRLTMLTPLDFSAGGVARVADWPLPFLVLQFRFWLSFPWREFVVVLEASAVTTWAASACSQRSLILSLSWRLHYLYNHSSFKYENVDCWGLEAPVVPTLTVLGHSPARAERKKKQGRRVRIMCPMKRGQAHAHPKRRPSTTLVSGPEWL